MATPTSRVAGFVWSPDPTWPPNPNRQNLTVWSSDPILGSVRFLATPTSPKLSVCLKHKLHFASQCSFCIHSSNSRIASLRLQSAERRLLSVVSLAVESHLRSIAADTSHKVLISVNVKAHPILNLACLYFSVCTCPKSPKVQTPLLRFLARLVVVVLRTCPALRQTVSFFHSFAESSCYVPLHY
jgi:hypothetical protein